MFFSGRSRLPVRVVVVVVMLDHVRGIGYWEADHTHIFDFTRRRK